MANATIETDYGWQTFDLVGTPGPPDVVQAPELLSSPLSIISACVVHDAAPPAFDMPDVDAGRPAAQLPPAMERWVGGFRFLPELVGPAGGWAWCATTPMPSGNNCEGVIVVNVFLAIELDQRSTAGYKASDAHDRVVRGLQAHEAWRVENQWWTGNLNPESPHLNGPNALLPVELQGGDPTDSVGLQDSLGLLEQAIAYRDAGVGVIHCTPFVFNAWATRGGIPFRYDGATPRSSSHIWTPNGNLVIPGYGYDGTGPYDIDTVQDPATQWATAQWAYVTDAIELLRGQIVVEPTEYAEMSPAIVTRNDVPWYATRPWAIYSNGGLRAAVLVDTTTL